MDIPEAAGRALMRGGSEEFVSQLSFEQRRAILEDEMAEARRLLSGNWFQRRGVSPAIKAFMEGYEVSQGWDGGGWCKCSQREDSRCRV